MTACSSEVEHAPEARRAVGSKPTGRARQGIAQPAERRRAMPEAAGAEPASLTIADCRLQIADCRLSVVRCPLSIAGRKSQVTDRRLQVAAISSCHLVILSRITFHIVRFSVLGSWFFRLWRSQAAHLHGTQEVGGAEPPSLTKWVASSNRKTPALQAGNPGAIPGRSTNLQL
jgi:hypothetical protein